MRVTALVLFCFLVVVCVEAKKKYCGSAFTALQKKVCTYDKESAPCLSGPVQSRRALEKCCTEGCSMADITDSCCFTPSCLKSCYPDLEQGTGKKRIHKMGGVY